MYQLNKNYGRWGRPAIIRPFVKHGHTPNTKIDAFPIAAFPSSGKSSTDWVEAFKNEKKNEFWFMYLKDLFLGVVWYEGALEDDIYVQAFTRFDPP